MIDLTKLMGLGCDREKNTINGHYGVSDKEYTEMVAEFIKDLLIISQLSDVIDKHFPKCDAKTRAKIVAYNTAHGFLAKITQLPTFPIR